MVVSLPVYVRKQISQQNEKKDKHGTHNLTLKTKTKVRQNLQKQIVSSLAVEG